MNEALGSASCRWRARPSMKLYWLRCALAGNNDDIAPLREDRVAVALFLRHEFPDRREHDAARADPQSRTQIRAAVGLYRLLTQQVPAACESGEQLVVEVVAVGDHDDRRVFHRRVQDQPPGI